MTTHMWEVASPAVDVDICQDQMFQKSSKPRRLVRIGVCGTAGTTGTGEFDVYYGSEKVMHIVSSGAAATASDVESGFYWHGSKLYLPAGTPLRIVVVEAPGVATICMVDLQEMVM